jgi:hypothetical protein
MIRQLPVAGLGTTLGQTVVHLPQGGRHAGGVEVARACVSRSSNLPLPPHRCVRAGGKKMTPEMAGRTFYAGALTSGICQRTPSHRLRIHGERSEGSLVRRERPTARNNWVSGYAKQDSACTGKASTCSGAQRRWSGSGPPATARPDPKAAGPILPGWTRRTMPDMMRP